MKNKYANLKDTYRETTEALREMEDDSKKNQNIIEKLREEFDLLGLDYNEKNIDLLVQAIAGAIWDIEKITNSKKRPLKCGEVVTALCFVLEQEHKKMIDN